MGGTPGEAASLKRSGLPRAPSRREGTNGGCEGGGFSERSPSLALPPEERLAFGLCASTGLVPPERWARFLARLLWSRRLTEPPRPANAGERKVLELAYHQKCHDGANTSWHFCKILQRQPTRRMSAAALSAAVDAHNSNGEHHPSGGTKPAEAHKPNASRSSGEGVWGRGASLREAASPPESPVTSRL